MGAYKLGYLNGLDGVSDWDAGKAEYDEFGATTLTLDSAKMCRAVGEVLSYSNTHLTAKNIINYPSDTLGTTFSQAVSTRAFEDDEFNGGFVRFLTGTLRNKVYKVTDTESTAYFNRLMFVGSSIAGVALGDWFEVVSGSCTFEFPVERNPINSKSKRAVVNVAKRFPFSQGGLTMFEGYQPDDFVLLVYLTTREDTDRLELMLNHNLDYVGFDGAYSYDTIPGSDKGLAPMILETGSHDANNQYLVYINDYKIIRDAKYNDHFSETTIHFLNYSGVIYRGV